MSILDFIEVKDDGGGGDNWSYKTCKSPVKSSPSTNQHPAFLQAGCPSYRPTNSVRALKGKRKTEKIKCILQPSCRRGRDHTETRTCSSALSSCSREIFSSLVSLSEFKTASCCEASNLHLSSSSVSRPNPSWYSCSDSYTWNHIYIYKQTECNKQTINWDYEECKKMQDELKALGDSKHSPGLQNSR